MNFFAYIEKSISCNCVTFQVRKEKEMEKRGGTSASRDENGQVDVWR